LHAQLYGVQLAGMPINIVQIGNNTEAPCSTACSNDVCHPACGQAFKVIENRYGNGTRINSLPGFREEEENSANNHSVS